MIQEAGWDETVQMRDGAQLTEGRIIKKRDVFTKCAPQARAAFDAPFLWSEAELEQAGDERRDTLRAETA